MKKNSEISEVFTIDTDENRCALLFCLQLQHELDDTSMLFLTANNYELVHDNLERIKPYLSYFDALHAGTKHLFLKDSWLALESQYGIRALGNELSSLVEHAPQELFFLHRIDLFFDKVFTPALEEVIIAFIKDVRYHHKKVIFSYNSQTVTGKAFEELLAQRRDISYHIEYDKNDIDGSCYSTIKTYNKFLKKPKAQIVLLSDDKDMISMHETIFAQENKIDFKHRTLDEIWDMKEGIEETTDIIIYHDKHRDLDAKMLEMLKEQAHFAQVFYLTDKKFLRKTDRTNAKENGIAYIVAKDFDIEEYISTVEEVIEDPFYTKKVKEIVALKMPQEVDFDGLKSAVMILKEKCIIFSLLSVNIDELSGLDSCSLIREHDYIYHDSENGQVVFVLLNILGNSAHDVLSNRLKIKKSAITLYKDVNIG